VNEPGLARLHELLASGDTLAFLGAGASAPLYPLWHEVVEQLVEAARPKLTASEAHTYRDLSSTQPETVVEHIRRTIGAAAYREVLRGIFRVRRDERTGHTWTQTQELIARCNFAGVVTTNYDPGILNARIVVRPDSAATGFASWTDDDELDRWRTRDIFRGDAVLPVLFAHGHHNQPSDMVLAETDYRRAYSGKLGRVLARLFDVERLVWIGFSFTDGRIGAILDELAMHSGPSREPGASPRHVAVMAWDPAPGGKGQALDPRVLRQLAVDKFGCELVLYPAPGGDHSALARLLAPLADEHPPGDLAHPDAPAREAESPDADSPGTDVIQLRWVHGGDRVEHFIGRRHELETLKRWARDPEVRLIGVTAWGGAGKTALVTEWLAGDGLARPTGGLFAWSFYEEPSEHAWATALVDWAEERFGPLPPRRRIVDQLVQAVEAAGLTLVLDGLEVMQEGPANAGYGRLLSGLLREALTTLARDRHAGLVVLTSRFPFADLERFDGGAARMLDVPPLTASEGSELFVNAGADWLEYERRRELIRAVDGHALAVGVMAAMLAERRDNEDVHRLERELATAVRTHERVSRVLEFYGERLADTDLWLVATVSLFARPVPARAVLKLGTADALGRPLAGWRVRHVQAAVEQRLRGLLTWHATGTISAHPLVRDAFRSMALSTGAVQLASEVTLEGLPRGRITSREDAVRVVEIVELLIEAGEWRAADELYQNRAGIPPIWITLPAAWLGQRCAQAFIRNDANRVACEQHLSRVKVRTYLNAAGVLALDAGDIETAKQYLRDATRIQVEGGDERDRASNLLDLAECLLWLGDAEQARVTASAGLAIADRVISPIHLVAANAYFAWALDAAGETALAEQAFAEANRLEYAQCGEHMVSRRACLWADFLMRTGRQVPAWRILSRCRSVSLDQGWSDDFARCERLLARSDASDGNHGEAQRRLGQAVEIFREGDMLLELAVSLVDLAELRRLQRRLDDAMVACAEALEIAAVRELVPIHASALAARARIRADGDRHSTEAARDDADHAYRLASSVRHLPWLQLRAFDAHTYLDRVEGRDAGWAASARAHRVTLIPKSLDTDPLVTSLPEPGPQLADSWGSRGNLPQRSRNHAPE
jgi:tetratricopeptide (TPR) repeat protein